MLLQSANSAQEPHTLLAQSAKSSKELLKFERTPLVHPRLSPQIWGEQCSAHIAAEPTQQLMSWMCLGDSSAREQTVLSVDVQKGRLLRHLRALAE